MVESTGIESAVADFMALIRVTGPALGISEYEVRIGLEWEGQKPLTILSPDAYGFGVEENVISLVRYAPVTATVVSDVPDLDFFWQVHDLAEDCINQGGVTRIHFINPPPRDE